MDLYLFISMTNNVESCKKINGRVQTFRFSVFTMGGHWLTGALCSKRGKQGKLKRELLRIIGCQSRVKIEEKIQRRGGVTKKRHGHNFQFWALSRNQRGTNHIGPTLIPYQSPKLNIVAVSFFLTPPLLRIFSSIFTWLWQPITQVKNLQNSKTTTFSESSGRQLSHGIPRLGHTGGNHWEKCVFVSRVSIKNRSFQQGALFRT